MVSAAQLTNATDTLEVPRDLAAAIRELSRERRAVILAHYYQEPEIQDIADFMAIRLSSPARQRPPTPR